MAGGGGGGGGGWGEGEWSTEEERRGPLKITCPHDAIVVFKWLHERKKGTLPPGLECEWRGEGPLKITCSYDSYISTEKCEGRMERKVIRRLRKWKLHNGLMYGPTGVGERGRGGRGEDKW